MEVERFDEPVQLQGREALAAWIGSGKAMQAYCDETGQSYWALRRWRLKFGEELGIEIRRRPGAVKANRSSARAVSKCVPIEIKTAGTLKAVSTVEIRLRGERTMVVDTDIDSTALSRLVVAIERAA